MNLGVVGLAYSHPYTYAQILQRMDHRVAFVWDDDANRKASFAAKFGATPVDSPESVPLDAIDGVILTGRLPERIDHAVYFVNYGVPVYVGKPMATTEEDLARLATAVRRANTPLLATSVLRFAPAFQSLQQHLDRQTAGTLLAVHAVAAHGISNYLQEPNVWQDDPGRGGGTVLTIGVHALEPLSVLVGSHIRRISCWTGRRVHKSSLSEDVALMTVEWTNGLLGSVDVIGGSDIEGYGVDLYGSANVVRIRIPRCDVQDFRGAALGAADPWEEFGYAGTMAAFIRMCQTGKSPVPLEESEAITKALLAARKSAGTGQPVMLGEDRS